MIGMVITMLFPFITSFYGELPTAQIVSAFVGYILLGATFISVGLFISSLTDNQIIAAFGTFGALFAFFMLDAFRTLIPVDTVSSLIFVGVLILIFGFIVYDATRSILGGAIVAFIGLLVIAVLYTVNPLLFDGVIVRTIGWFSVLARFTPFHMGILDVAAIVYYITFAMIFIYLTINTIEKRRWK
jgi:ABC-2 type transport system permease protein